MFSTPPLHAPLSPSFLANTVRGVASTLVGGGAGLSGESLKFGTSGLRGLVTDLEGPAARRYTAAFIAHLRQTGQLGTSGRVFIGQDYRPSSPSIAKDCAAAIRAAGLVPVDCGASPTPALALHAMQQSGPAIMITGSHIPADRNGLKFYSPSGEITKDDEAGITAAAANASDEGAPGATEDHWAAAQDLYRQRYRFLLPPETLIGMKIGVFEHSTVARDMLVSLLVRAGAEVVRLGRVEGFVAVDTEAYSDAVFAPVKGWIAEHHLDALVSADGDGDRPLLADADGNFVRGDAMGVIAAKYLGIETLVTPVTSNSGIEGAGSFERVLRTRVGSPYVLAGLAEAGGSGRIAGFEANGGLMLGSDVPVNGRTLPALPTRDAVLPILCVLGMAAREGIAVAELVRRLRLRHAVADRLTDVPMARSWSLLRRLSEINAFSTNYFSPVGAIEDVTTIDGSRVTLGSGDVIHYRASGNAPELRCYVEAVSPERAAELLDFGLRAAKDFVTLVEDVS